MHFWFELESQFAARPFPGAILRAPLQNGRGAGRNADGHDAAKPLGPFGVSIGEV